jgi:hypothetical protein
MQPGVALTTPDPLTVGCPDCGVPAGTDCTSAYDTFHSARCLRAEVRGSTQHGTCRDCGQPLTRYREHGILRVLHTDPQDAAACPPIPDPATDLAEWAAARNSGLEPGKPPVDAWQPLSEGNPL